MNEAGWRLRIGDNAVGVAKNETANRPIVEFSKSCFDISVELGKIRAMLNMKEGEMLSMGIPERHEWREKESGTRNHDIRV